MLPVVFTECTVCLQFIYRVTFIMLSQTKYKFDGSKNISRDYDTVFILSQKYIYIFDDSDIKAMFIYRNFIEAK